LCTVIEDAKVREEFCRDFGPLGNNFYFFAGSQQDMKKSQGIFSFFRK